MIRSSKKSVPGESSKLFLGIRPSDNSNSPLVVGLLLIIFMDIILASPLKPYPANSVTPPIRIVFVFVLGTNESPSIL